MDARLETRTTSELPRVVLFSGGTACRTINLALSRRGYQLTRIVPAWDSGGSSKVLREAFGMIPVGDVRQALMTMAHGEGRAGNVVRVCNARLSGDLSQADLAAELDYYVSGQHPLIAAMPDAMRTAMLGYLRLFAERAGPDFDLRNGSVGNFVLTGAYFANDRDIGRAIAAFRQLCDISGEVWPASMADDVQLRGVLNDGRIIPAQHLLTRLNDADSAVGIADIALVRSASAPIEAKPAVLAAIAAADVIVVGPGSFYTSILPHLLVAGVKEAIRANRTAAKVFVGNVLECSETRGVTLDKLLGAILTKLGGERPAISHVFSNRELFPFQKTAGRSAYVRFGGLQAMCDQLGISNIVGDFEDAWTRGQHDGDAVADGLAAIVNTPSPSPFVR